MNQLKFKLWAEGKTVKFQVLEMPEELRGRVELFRAGNGVTVCSIDCPDLWVDSIFLRGKEKHNDVSTASRTFDSIPEAHRAFANYLEALQEFAEKYKLTDQAEPSDDAHTYTLTFTN